jgi:bifunctional DNase/RNase
MSEPRESFVALVLGLCTVGALASLGLSFLRQPSSRVELKAKELIRVGSGQEVLVMIEKDGSRRLPIPVTRADANRIERALNGGPHGLSNASLEALGGRVLHASIDEISRIRGFRGHLSLGSGLREMQLDATAGEALALALEAGAPILADVEVLDEAGVSPEDLQGKSARTLRSSAEPAPVLGI